MLKIGNIIGEYVDPLFKGFICLFFKILFIGFIFGIFCIPFAAIKILFF